jgi:hypothetical protein
MALWQRKISCRQDGNGSLTAGTRPHRLEQMFKRFPLPASPGELGLIVFAVAIVFSILSPEASGAQDKKSQSTGRSVSSTSAGAAELAKLRANVIEKMKETRAGTEKLLALHEEEVKKLTAEYQQRRELYSRGLISRVELNQAERALAVAMIRADEDRRWIAESDIAITEASMRDVLLGLPAMAPGGYSESGTLIRFNGAAPWSLTDATRIERFFSQTFGHTLPITAFGQTPTHDRLRFDHRNAMDVALHPDSKEGQSLLSYLRGAGIPFIAFRGAVPGAATGAHIHIGKPSLRAMGSESRAECCK